METKKTLAEASVTPSGPATGSAAVNPSSSFFSLSDEKSKLSSDENTVLTVNTGLTKPGTKVSSLTFGYPLRETKNDAARYHLRETKKGTPVKVVRRDVSGDPTKPRVTLSYGLDPPAASDACLVMIHGDDVGHKYCLDQAKIVLGRSAKADIIIDTDSVSRNHAEVSRNGTSVTISDLGSTNGTYVNDERIEKHVLRNGDLVKLGRIGFKFLCSDNIEYAYHEEIHRLTMFDGMFDGVAEVYNKRHLVRHLQRMLADEKNQERPLSLMVFNPNQFQNINDEHGYLGGDVMLKQLAKVVRGQVGSEDLLARYSGIKFVLLLPGMDLAQARTKAGAIATTIEKEIFCIDTNLVPLTVSIGVACAEPSDDADTLIQRAWQRLPAEAGPMASPAA